jgi:hypothetical protein
MVHAQESSAEQPTTSEKLKTRSSNSSCLKLVSEYLRRQPYTSALLVKEINMYGSSHVNNCLRKLRNAGLIGATWDKRQACYVYYNIKL